jgi:hypothetical protein
VFLSGGTGHVAQPLEQMATALLWAVENPPAQTRILDVPAIRAISG